MRIVDAHLPSDRALAGPQLPRQHVVEDGDRLSRALIAAVERASREHRDAEDLEAIPYSRTRRAFASSGGKR